MRNYHRCLNPNGKGSLKDCFPHQINFISRTNANRIYGRTLLNSSQTVPYYPQTPPSGNDTPEFYYRLAPDTLFFVFYYMEVSLNIFEMLQTSNSFSGNSCAIFSCKSIETSIMAFSYQTYDVVSTPRRTKDHHRWLRTGAILLHFISHRIQSLLSRVHIYFSIMNVGKHVNATILSSNTSFWKIENFESMLVVHEESEEEEEEKKKYLL